MATPGAETGSGSSFDRGGAGGLDLEFVGPERNGRTGADHEHGAVVQRDLRIVIDGPKTAA